MKKGSTAFLLCLVLAVAAQHKKELQTAPFNTNDSVLVNDSTRSKRPQLKQLPLSANGRVYLSLGADARWQYFVSHNENWGDVGFTTDQYGLQRYLLQAELQAGPRFRFLLQTQNSWAIGRKNRNPIEHNPIELHQLFMAGQFSSEWEWQMGRQEWLFGSQRLIGVREGPNSRLSFDAARMVWKKEAQRFDLFYGRPVRNKSGSLNDRSSSDIAIWGLYVVKSKLPRLKNVDLYYLGYHRSNAVYDLATGSENRHSVGVRVWSVANSWKYDLEALYQWGRLNDWKIRAWTVSANISYQFEETNWKPQPGMKAELISGDRNPHNQKLGSFNAMFPRGAYFGLAALIGPANLADWHPSLLLEPGKSWQLGLDYDLFWRFSRYDALYATNGAILYSGQNVSSNFIGSQASFNISKQWNSWIESSLEFTWFNSGRFLKEAGTGRDILFTGITIQAKY